MECVREIAIEREIVRKTYIEREIGRDRDR